MGLVQCPAVAAGDAAGPVGEREARREARRQATQKGRPTHKHQVGGEIPYCKGNAYYIIRSLTIGGAPLL